MIKTAQHHELALDDLDTVVGGGSTLPTLYFQPVAIQATGQSPSAGLSPGYATPSAANNYGLANHFDLAFPAMAAHDAGHVADGLAPSVPGQLGAPAALSAATVHIDPSGAGDLAGQDAHLPVPGAAGIDTHATQAAALPFSLMPVPGELTAAATPAIAAAPAPADTGAALYFGLPGGTDPTHDDASHASTNDWAPGSFSDSAAASSATGW